MVDMAGGSLAMPGGNGSMSSRILNSDPGDK
jgi:hypothetical protein